MGPRRMFKKKTVFVVGAGASCEVGLPAGDKLKGIIGNKLNIRFENFSHLASGDPDIVEACRSIAGRGDINPLRAAGVSIVANLDFSRSSILPTKSHMAFISVGETALAFGNRDDGNTLGGIVLDNAAKD